MPPSGRTSTSLLSRLLSTRRFADIFGRDLIVGRHAFCTGCVSTAHPGALCECGNRKTHQASPATKLRIRYPPLPHGILLCLTSLYEFSNYSMQSLKIMPRCGANDQSRSYNSSTALDASKRAGKMALESRPASRSLMAQRLSRQPDELNSHNDFIDEFCARNGLLETSTTHAVMK
jgi:hypothetical protein